MALNLDGTTGITSDSGTPVIENLNTTATGIDITGQLTTTGNVGIGTSSPTDKLTVSNGGIVVNSGNVKVTDGSTAFQMGVNNFATGYGMGTTSSTPLIFAANGSERMRIDSAGRVTMPYQPAFFVGRTSNFSYTGNDQTQPMVFDLVNRNMGGHYNASTGLFTAPVTGNYCFASGGYTSANLEQMWFIVNGVRTETYGTFDGQNATTSASGIVYLLAGDSLGIHYYVNVSSVTLYPNPNHTFFRGFLVG